MFAELGKRFSFGGQVGSDQRIYYINTRELTGNKYGTPNPVPFRVVDQRAGIDIDIGIRCFGEYSYRVVNPCLLYTSDVYKRQIQHVGILVDLHRADLDDLAPEGLLHAMIIKDVRLIADVPFQIK